MNESLLLASGLAVFAGLMFSLCSGEALEQWLGRRGWMATRANVLGCRAVGVFLLVLGLYVGQLAWTWTPTPTPLPPAPESSTLSSSPSAAPAEALSSSPSPTAP